MPNEMRAIILIPIVFWVMFLALTIPQKWIDSSEHKDYESVVAMETDFSEMHVGQSIDLQKYDGVSLKSGNKTILQVGTSDDSGWFSNSKLVLVAAAKGDTILTISDKSSDDFKVVNVHVE